MEAEKQFGRNYGRNTTKIQFVEQDGFWGRKNKTAVIIEMWDITRQKTENEIEFVSNGMFKTPQCGNYSAK